MKNLRRVLAILLLTAMSVMTLAACGKSAGAGSGDAAAANGDAANEAAGEADETATGGDLLFEIQGRGRLIIAMEGQWAPWTYHDENGKLVGFDTEVGEAIAEKLGVEAEFVEGEWDGLFTGMDGGRYDVIINGVEITDERKEKYDFSTPYAYIKTALVVAEDNTDITSFEDLKGKKTSNSLGSTYADMAAEYGAEVANVDTLSETIDMVLSGRADATLNAEVSFYDYLKEHPDAPIKIVALTDEASEVSIPMRKSQAGDGDTASLRAAIDKAIKELAEEGKLAELSEKYFGSDITKK